MQDEEGRRRRQADDGLAESEFGRFGKRDGHDLDGGAVLVADPEKDRTAWTVGHGGHIGSSVLVAFVCVLVDFDLEVEVGVLSDVRGHHPLDCRCVDFTQPTSDECLDAR